ncbi:MAG: UDP-N-acetylmuramate dehydrogenase [Rickettsiales bacterium]|jgi:UDP-N-acetylmuramate dehydrogenase|nr:UDP-N-acetylmuramate dehydrogenase [Rickettsiales bacterium]
MAELKTDISLSKFTRFKTGGRADLFFAPDSADELSQFLRGNTARPITVLGFGSNVLIRDGGIGGVVIFTGGMNQVNSQQSTVNSPQSTVIAGAGAAMPMIAGFALKHSIAGFEFMVGIPGTAAGGLATNAGCFGGQISDVLVGVSGLDFDGNPIDIPAADLCLSYRAAKLPKEFIITELKFRGIPGKAAEIRQKMDDIIAKKTAAQPIDARTAGSVFKNPDGGAAWRRILDAFPNGLAVGGARISDKHANFIIADGDCRSADIEDLIKQIQAKTGLELEIKILGNDTN